MYKLERVSNTIVVARELLDFLGDVAAYAHLSDIPIQEKQDLRHLAWIATIPFFWRKAAGVKKEEIASTDIFTAAARYAVLIARYDDLIDEQTTHFLQPEEFKQDGISKRVLSQLISLLRISPASKDLIEKFLKDLGNFRRQEIIWHNQFAEGRELLEVSLEDVAKFKERTCGLNARMSARLCRLFAPNVSDIQAQRAEDTSYAVFMYFQMCDDQRDFLEDNGRVPNYLNAALYENTEELSCFLSAIEQGQRRLTLLRPLAPRSFSLCDKIAQGYFKLIPPLPASLRISVRALSEVAFSTIKENK